MLVTLARNRALATWLCAGASALILATGLYAPPGPARAQTERSEQNFFHLFDAIASGSYRRVRRLLPRRNIINDIDGSSGATLLTWVSITRFDDESVGERMVRLFLDRGADPNITDRSGDSPLHAAISYSRPRIVALLIERGANVNFSHPRYERPPLVSLCDRVGAEWPERGAARMSIARAMLAAGADPNGSWQRGDARFTIADECAHTRIFPLVRLVLRAGGTLSRYEGREGEFLPTRR